MASSSFQMSRLTGMNLAKLNATNFTLL